LPGRGGDGEVEHAALRLQGPARGHGRFQSALRLRLLERLVDRPRKQGSDGAVRMHHEALRPAQGRRPDRLRSESGATERAEGKGSAAAQARKEGHPDARGSRGVLEKNAKARATFAGFRPSHKREYLEWITEAKTEETRRKRLDTAVGWMAEGKPRNWKYQKASTGAASRAGAARRPGAR
jgi:Bacteriocin-protection, YdeI or OmpD-Associated